MFSGRNVTAESFTKGEKVWVIFESRIREAAITQVLTGCQSNEHGEPICVRIDDTEVRYWVSPQDVFKRPTEYHLLQAAIDSLIEDLQRDRKFLLVASE